jgi:hypothetical protein
MKKKNQTEQKAQNQPVKTGSSEKAIDKVDFPPELADFLGESLRGIREQLGLKPEDSIPIDALREHFQKLFKDSNIEKLLCELKCDKLFGLQEDYDGKFYQSVDDEEDVPSPDDFTDEEISDMDFSDLDKDQYGNTVLSTIVLAGAEEGEDFLDYIFPALPGDKEAEAHHLVIHVYVPYIDVVRQEELEDLAKKYKEMKQAPRVLTQDGEIFFVLDENTYQSFLEAARECGVNMDEKAKEVETVDDFKTMMRELTANGEVIHGIDSNARADGYYEDLCEYWYDGVIYHEKDVIWFELPKLRAGERIQGFVANLDHYGKLYTGVDVTRAKTIKVEGGYRVLSKEEIFEIKYNHQNEDFFRQLLPAEEVWYLASEYAKTKDTPGYCVVCRNGKFNVPIESFMNYETFEFDELIEVFNILPCFLTHHKCQSFLVADVGNMQMKTAVRFLKGRTFDWGKRVEQEIDMYHKYNPDFDPYEDPYSDPNNSYIERDGDDDDDE